MKYEEIGLAERSFVPLAEIIKRNYNGREVLLYGDSQPLRNLLETAYGINARRVITGLKEKVTEEISFIRDFSGQFDKYYIAVPDINPEQNIKNNLVSMGYNEFSDFAFKKHNPLKSDKGFKNYHDEYGNIISAPAGVTIILDAESGNVNINIDDTVKFNTNAVIHIANWQTKISIAENCKIGRDFRLTMFGDSFCSIEKGTTVNDNCNIRIHHGGKLLVGKECMFSYDIKLLVGDGHAIFDVETRKRTLDVTRDNPRNSLTIKERVWVGLNAVVLGNTTIGRSSVVGAGAVVKGTFPNNCVIVGNPAKIVRKNITWSRNNFENDISKCGEENIKMTEL